MGMRGLLTTLALGAGAMYLFDPERGEERRKELSVQFKRFSQDAEHIWHDGINDLQTRAQELRGQESMSVEDRLHRAGGLERGPGEGMQTWLGGNGHTQMEPGPRLLAIAGGSLLTLYGRTRGGIKGGAMTAIGLNLLSQGVSNKSLPQLVQEMKGEALEEHPSGAM